MTNPSEQKLSEGKLGRARARLRLNLFNEVLSVFRAAKKENGLTQQMIADRLGIDKAVVSRRLKGDDFNLTIETLADMFIAMGAQLSVKGVLDTQVHVLHNTEVKTNVWRTVAVDTCSASLNRLVASYIDNAMRAEPEAFIVSAARRAALATFVNSPNKVCSENRGLRGAPFRSPAYKLPVSQSEEYVLA